MKISAILKKILEYSTPKVIDMPNYPFHVYRMKEIDQKRAKRLKMESTPKASTDPTDSSDWHKLY